MTTFINPGPVSHVPSATDLEAVTQDPARRIPMDSSAALQSCPTSMEEPTLRLPVYAHMQQITEPVSRLLQDSDRASL